VSPVAKLDYAGMVRVAKDQVRLATRGLDGNGMIEAYLDAIPVRISRRRSHCRMGFFQGGAGDDIGHVMLNAGLCDTEARFMDTLYHELAHAVNRWLNGRDCDSHGPQWQAIMIQLGQQPTRCLKV
jgi:hypothetical protein